ncbi:MAG: hypothetical protein V1796_00970 [Pseudomonadota bacterium]
MNSHANGIGVTVACASVARRAALLHFSRGLLGERAKERELRTVAAAMVVTMAPRLDSNSTNPSDTVVMLAEEFSGF